MEIVELLLSLMAVGYLRRLRKKYFAASPHFSMWALALAP
jgi:hypothetical protein